MNTDLYNEIKDELASLEGNRTQPKAVSSLLGQKILNKNEKDKFTVIYAFYEYMSSKEAFSFIKSGDWSDFFRNNFSKYLTIDRIELIFNDIINDENLIKTLLNVCSNEVKKNFYHCVKNKNTLYLKAGDKKYEKIFNEIKKSLIEQGLIKQDKKEVNYESNKDFSKRQEEIDAEIARLSKEKEKIEADKVSKRDDLFGKAGAVIGVNPDKLIRKVGNENSFVVDRIVLDQRLADKIAANEAIVATKPKNVFDRMKKKVSNALMLSTVNFEIVDNNGLNVLKISKEQGTLDKMASSDSEVLRAIANSVRIKTELFKQLVKPSEEVLQSLKAVFKATNEKFISSVKNITEEAKLSYVELKDNLRESYNEKKSEVSEKANQLKADITDYGIQVKEKIADKMQDAAATVKDTASEVKSSYGELKDNLKEVYEEQKSEVKAKTDELVSRISDYGVSTREKVSDKLHKVADKIAPNNPKETVTYITTPNGQRKRLIVKVATKAGQIPSFKEEKSRKM